MWQARRGGHRRTTTTEDPESILTRQRPTRPGQVRPGRTVKKKSRAKQQGRRARIATAPLGVGVRPARVPEPGELHCTVHAAGGSGTSTSGGGGLVPRVRVPGADRSRSQSSRSGRPHHPPPRTAGLPVRRPPPWGGAGGTTTHRALRFAPPPRPTLAPGG